MPTPNLQDRAQPGAPQASGPCGWLSSAAIAAAVGPKRSHQELERALNSERTKRQWAWVRAVAADTDQPHAAVRLAVVLIDYFNRESGVAWPSQKTLKAALGLKSESALVAILDSMEAGGHLGRKSGKGARVKSLYWPLLPAEVPKAAENRGFFEHANPRLSDKKPPGKPNRSPSETPGLKDKAAYTQLHDSSLRDPFEEAVSDEGYPANAVEQLKRRYPEQLRHLKADRLSESILSFKDMGLLWQELLSVLAEGIPHLAAGKVRADLFGTFEGNAQVAISRRKAAEKAEAAWAAAEAERAVRGSRYPDEDYPQAARTA